jgi:hypothetical protein
MKNIRDKEIFVVILYYINDLFMNSLLLLLNNNDERGNKKTLVKTVARLTLILKLTMENK